MGSGDQTVLKEQEEQERECQQHVKWLNKTNKKRKGVEVKYLNESSSGKHDITDICFL